MGITRQVTQLKGENGFLNNELVKIAWPSEIQKVDQTLRKIGLSSLADEGAKLLNRAAEDAVGTAIPIFKDAVLNMSIQDAKGILLGADDAATTY